MAAITVRNLSDETHRALKARAVSNGRSTEAEVRQILDEAVMGRVEIGFGTQFVELAAEVGGFDLDLDRDQSSSEPPDFG